MTSVGFIDLKEHMFLQIFPECDLGIEINWEYRFDEGPFTLVFAKVDDTTFDEFKKAMSSLYRRIKKSNPEYEKECKEFQDNLAKADKEQTINNILNSL